MAGLQAQGERRFGSSVPWFTAALGILGIAYLVCLDEVAGLFVDDGWYVVLASALATGNGFTLVNAPVSGVLPFYPPGFPALLALVFLVAPDFPANVGLLKAVSVVALLLGAVLLRHYFVRCRGESGWIGSGLALLAVASGLMHFLLTSAVLSEGVFVCVQAAAIVAVERCARGAATRTGQARALLLAAVLVVATFLVRSIGVLLAPSAVIYLLARGGPRQALLLAAAIVAFAAPWQIHATLRAPTAQQRAVVNDAIAFSYAEHFALKRAGQAEFGRDTLADFPGRVARNLRQLTERTIGTLYAHALLERTALVVPVSLLATALTVLGLVAAARARLTVVELYVPATVCVLLGFGFNADRYLLPLLPFLACYAVTGCALLVRGALRIAGLAAAPAEHRAAQAGTALLVALLLVNTAGLARDVADTLGAAPGRRSAWRRAFAENLGLLAWVRERIPRTVVLATHNPGMVFLYTGNPTVGSWEGGTNAANWRAAGARFWVDNTVAEYRFPDMVRSGLEPLVTTERLRLGVYRTPAPGFPLR
jgi:hypothetical protein